MDQIDRYLAHLNMKREDLRGKFILDVGAGYARFAHKCASEGLAEVVSLDSDAIFLGRSWRVRVAQARENERSGLSIPNVLFGRAEHLPFRDAVFDLVIAHFSIPRMCASGESVRLGIQEMCRVGNEVRIVPICREEGHPVNQWVEEALSEVAANPRFHIERQTSVSETVSIPGRKFHFRLCIIRRKP